ncbi:hypothetical protein JOC86_002834 [Bacillus pakistanensis]|uniref:NERD domain-containing protein n=1 Tax=Rossellomorea pakistanensis TaxID=992288 RepID=A0ABS2NEK4_9BACI|nr:hypothetical protein [Bacillus pakistanensis]MBM7586292.1 hypothetical protein [Bacillus pakistanensis]
MIEMQGEGLKFSNQLAGYAKAFHVGLISVLSIVTVGCIGLLLYLLFFHFSSGLPFLLLIPLLIFGFMAVLTYKNYRQYLRYKIINELNNEGYYTFFKDFKSGEEKEDLIPYEQMEKIIIGKTSRYTLNNRKDFKTLYIVGVNIIFVWKKEGSYQFKTFGIENQYDLDQWIEQFQKHNVKIVVTEKNIRYVPEALYKEVFLDSKVDLQPFQKQLEIGHTTYQKMELFISQKEMKNIAENMKRLS